MSAFRVSTGLHVEHRRPKAGDVKPPIPKYFLKTGSPAKSSRRLWFCQRALVFEIVMQFWASQPDISLHVSVGQNQIREIHSFSGPIASRVFARCILSRISNESFMHADKISCCIFGVDSFFRLTSTCLAVFLVLCSLS